MKTPSRSAAMLGLVVLFCFGLPPVAEAQQLKILRDGAQGGDNRVFEVTNDSVQIGRSGDATNESSDTDLIVYDPFFTFSATEPALHFDASIVVLRLGSGNPTNTGTAGTLLLDNGQGGLGFQLSGGTSFFGLGSSKSSGNILVRNQSLAGTFVVDGSSGDVRNSLGGDGLVKAWARIDANGTVVSCFRCHAAQTQLLTGSFVDFYEVDFTPLSTDISGRPRLVTLDNSIADFQGPAAPDVATRNGDASSVAVRFSSTQDVHRAFTIVIF